MSVIQEDVRLMPFNTFHMDVRARYLTEVHDVEQLQDFLSSGHSRIRPRFILGGGSNVLFKGNYKGMIIRPLIMGIEKLGEDGDSVYVRVGAGENWDSFVYRCVETGLGGIENLSLIPGTVGASPIQNIGAYGVEVKEVIHRVEAVMCDEGKMISLPNSGCRFGYRDSIFKNELRDKVIITYVTFRLDKKHQPKIQYAELERELNKYQNISAGSIREAVIHLRRSKLPDPDEIGNAGSFFKNPVIPQSKVLALREKYPAIPAFEVGPGIVKLSAAWLIDQCGWKGKRKGNTGTYSKQPLILLNHGEATGKEILEFAGEIQQSVMDRYGLRLEMEVNVV
jgi:UDP-N-acetylmuramate dehydrogenase